MHIAVIQFPGSTCERETMLAVKRAGMIPVEFLWNEPQSKLLNCDGYILTGGFSYEDRGRAGVVAAQDPIMQVIREQSEIGKPVLGICNGAQILVESGLVPGIEDYKVGIALTDNQRIQQGKILGTGYYNAWVHMRLADEYQYNAFTRHLRPQQILRVPVAHSEGRFIIPPALLLEMQANGQNVFQYCDEKGAIINEFPINPNGSINNIAAVSNKNGNVMAIMPHPERIPEGDAILNSMREYIVEGYKQHAKPLAYYPRPVESKKYKTTSHQLIVELMIADNYALTVENVLRQRGIIANIKRQIHWEIDCDSIETLERIKKSGVLYNEHKEFLVNEISADQPSKQIIQLIRAKDNIQGIEKKQQLKDHFAIEGLHDIKHGVLWHITAKDEATIKKVLDTQLLFNPIVHECYDY